MKQKHYFIGLTPFLYLFILLALVKVWLLSSLYPVFNVSDENHHYALVAAFAEGNVPLPDPSQCKRSAQTAYEIISVATPEYLKAYNEQFEMPILKVPPLYKGLVDQAIKRCMETKKNVEAGSPPLYYTLAGVWLKAGRLLGIQTWVPMPFWVRWFNVLLIASLLWATLRIARRLFPEDRAAQASLIGLVAFFPCEYYYYATPDVLAALLGALFFALLLETMPATPRSEPQTPQKAQKLSALACLFFVVGVALPLTKLSTVVWAIAMVMLALLYFPKGWRGPLVWGALGCFCGLAGFALCNFIRAGDPLGVASKTTFLGWTAKPVGQWLDHPLWSLPGFCTFLRATIVTLWRGDLYWRTQPLEIGTGLDYLYVGLTLAFLLAAPIWLVWRGRKAGAIQESSVAAGWLVLMGSLAFLMWISVKFDFGNCYFPSRHYPFMSAGRLISTAQVPLLAGLMVLGQALLKRLGWHWMVWGVLCLAMIVQQAWCARLAAPSIFNWFHL